MAPMGRKGQYSDKASRDNPTVSTVYVGSEVKERLMAIAKETRSSLSAVIVAFIEPHVNGDTLAHSIRSFEDHRQGKV